MRVALFGGTGFVGSYIVDALVERGHTPVLMVRPGSEDKLRHGDACETVEGEIEDERAVRRALAGCDAAIYNIGILREEPGVSFVALQYEGAKRTMDAAMEEGVYRFLLMSANGVKANGTRYQETKYLAERYLAQTELAYTIFRPSVVFGDPRGRMEFCTQLKEQMIAPPIPAPAFYEGLKPPQEYFRMAPVFVEDVAAAFAGSLENTDTHGRTLILCGPDEYQWPEIVRVIGRAIGKDKLVIPVPAALVMAAAAVLDRFSFFPITRDQLTMLLEGNTGGAAGVYEGLGIRPTPFNEEALGYLSAQG